MPADIFAYKPLPASDEVAGVMREACDALVAQGATWMRATIVSSGYPRPNHPDGLYFEGWLIRPEEEGEMDFPLGQVPA